MDLYERFSAYTGEHHLLEPGERIVVGVSGGADSLCLLDMLSRSGVDLIVAHLDHKLRPESGQEAGFVRSIAEDYSLPFELGEVEDVSFEDGSLEERARLARYRFLVVVARKHGVQKIAVGHTYDDQVETVLMHFLRGTGPAGLRGMLPARRMNEWVGIDDAGGIVLIRPLLAIRHAEAQDHCEQLGLEPRFDRSNLDTTFFRNRIRHQLLPILEEYNPGVRAVIHSLGEIMRSEVEFIQGQVDLTWPAAVEILDADAILLRGGAIREFPTALQRRILKRAIRQLRPEVRDLGFDQIERLRLFLLNPQRQPSSPVVADLSAYDCADDILLSGAGKLPLLPDFPQISNEVPLETPPSADLPLANGWHISISIQEDVNMKDIEAQEGTGWDVYLDRDSLKQPTVLRRRQPGDWIQPLGMQGRMKVSDLMINRKVPRLAREHWPLLVSGGEVVWVPGLHIAHPFRVTAETGRVVRLAVMRP